MSDTDSENDKIVVNETIITANSSSDDEFETGFTDDENKSEKQDVEKMSTTQPQPRKKRFIPKYEVEGVSKVVLKEETQIHIEMAVGVHVNSQHPWKFVNKESILEHIEIAGDTSEFFSLKELLEAYTDDHLLMGYIADESNDDDEFYICYTTEARDYCKQQSDRFIKRQEKKLEKAVQKKPRPWKSLGSDREIQELKPVNSRPLFEIEIKTKFPSAYQPGKFQIRDTNIVRDGFIELTPYRQKFNNIFRCRVDVGIQAAPPQFEKHVQTDLRYPKNMWTQSIADVMGKEDDTKAGGDTEKNKNEIKSTSDDDDDDDENNTKKDTSDDVELAAYKSAFKRMRRTSYIKMISKFILEKKTEMDSIVELNTVMDIYCNDYPYLVAENTIGVYDSMQFEEYVCFTDVRAKDKYVSCAVFHPMWSGIVAICYADGSPNVLKTLSTCPDPIQRAVYGLNPVMIWSHIDSLIPKLYLESPREVKTLSFCPFDENLLIGGCINGQIIIWDLSNKLENVENVEVLSETREKYKIAMNAHMGWMKKVQDNGLVTATAVSNLLTSHYGPVTSINWLSPNFLVTPTGKQILTPDKNKSLMFLTGSEDGNILIWNLSVQNMPFFETKKIKKSKRVLKRPSALMVDVSPFKVLDRILQPIYKLILGIAGQPFILPLQNFAFNYPTVEYIKIQKNYDTGRKYFTCEILNQSESELSMDLYCGSQHGELRRVIWEGHDFNTGEVVNSEYTDIKYSCYIHDGIVSCTLKNPFNNKLTLSVGGKIFAIWSDELMSRPLIWKKRSCRLTDGAWSLYKASLLFISTADGDLETWDLLLRSDKPICVQTLSGTSLTGVSLHSLPLTKNMIGVSDMNGSFRMFLDPPLFMLENQSYSGRMENMILRELKVMKSFLSWQEKWMKQNPDVLLEIRRKEALLIADKEDKKRKLREEEEKRLEAEAEAKLLQQTKVIGPEERWQMIIHKLIEKTIAVKKRINRVELIEQEKPLRELEAQRLEKEKRMLDIMKNQKAIFNDTVAILFPEAIKKTEKVKKTLLADDKENLKQEFMQDYNYLKEQAFRTVRDHPYKVSFSWEASLAEGKERRQALNCDDNFIKMHKLRLEEDYVQQEPKYTKSKVSTSKTIVFQDDIESAT